MTRAKSLTWWPSCFLSFVVFVSFVTAQGRRIDDAALKRAGQTGDEWLTYGLDQSETRFSPLKDIDTTNVSRLGLAWSYDVGSLRGLEATRIDERPAERAFEKPERVAREGHQWR